MAHSIGLIESKGLVALVEAADVILKNSPVKLLGIHKLDNGLVSLAVSGNSDYVKAAIESGTEAGQRVGEIYAHSVVDDPKEELIKMFSELFSGVDKSQTTIISSSKDTSDIENAEEHHIFENIVKKIKPDSKREKSKPLVVTEITTVKKTKTHKENSSSKNEFEDGEKNKNVVLKTNSIPEKIDLPNDSISSLSTIERLRQEALGFKSKEVKSKENFGFAKSDIKENKSDIDGTNKKIVDFEAIEGMNVHKLRHYARDFSNFPIKGREISRANRDELVELFKTIK
jgi:microcompartment protein CcmL/EutN